MRQTQGRTSCHFLIADRVVLLGRIDSLGSISTRDICELRSTTSASVFVILERIFRFSFGLLVLGSLLLLSSDSIGFEEGAARGFPRFTTGSTEGAAVLPLAVFLRSGRIGSPSSKGRVFDFGAVFSSACTGSFLAVAWIGVARTAFFTSFLDFSFAPSKAGVPGGVGPSTSLSLS